MEPRRPTPGVPTSHPGAQAASQLKQQPRTNAGGDSRGSAGPPPRGPVVLAQR